ncbi:MAG: 2-oxo acid dehydrogenase subunit E2 [Thermoplasmatota archaeon]
MDRLARLVQPQWPPLAHVERGWNALTRGERDEVDARVRAVLAVTPGAGNGEPELLRTFWSFLAQVETIAIEIPLRFLPDAAPEQARLLRRQLVDEVFHSTLFARLAHEAGGGSPAEPLPAAERLLDAVRAQEDPATSAVLLNLVAEGWIETLFDHAATWGIADAVFQTVLADESRHVHEALEHAAADGLDPAKAQAAVHRFEADLMALNQEPTINVALLALAGPERHRALVQGLHDGHRQHLAEVGLEPSPEWVEQEEAWTAAMANGPGEDGADPTAARPTVVPDNHWRRLTRQVWETPRDPTMQGGFDVPVGHIPKRLLTPVLIAAIGRAWKEHPELNRVVARDRVWQLPHANVGVRVLLDDGELATVVVTEADRRSIADIAFLIQDGLAQLKALWQDRPKDDAARTFDPEAGRWLEPGPLHFSVALSNPGKFGLVAGAGAFSGHLAPSSDLTIGERRRLPLWRGLAYLPAWHVHVGCLQDHRVFDGREAGLGMRALREGLGKRGVKEILRRPDTLAHPEPAAGDGARDTWTAALPPELRAMSYVGLGKFAPFVIGGAAVGAAAVGGGVLLAKKMGQNQQQEQQTVIVIEDDDEEE